MIYQSLYVIQQQICNPMIISISSSIYYANSTIEMVLKAKTVQTQMKRTEIIEYSSFYYDRQQFFLLLIPFFETDGI